MSITVNSLDIKNICITVFIEHQHKSISNFTFNNNMLLNYITGIYSSEPPRNIYVTKKYKQDIGSEHDDKLVTWKTDIQEYFLKKRK